MPEDTGGFAFNSVPLWLRGIFLPQRHGGAENAENFY